MMDEATKHFVKEQTPGVVFQPTTHHALQLGVNLLADAIKPTLGPMPRSVVVEEPERARFPEILDNGALIARRVTELSDPNIDMGAMLLRQMLWTLYERNGDGTATAATLFQSLFNDGLRLVAAGYDPQKLKHYLLTGMKTVLDQIQMQAIPIDGQEQLQQFAYSVTHNSVLSKILAEVFNTLGTFAHINLRSGYHSDYEHNYLHGILWESGVHTRDMVLDPKSNKTELQFATILASDFELEEPKDLAAIIDVVAPHYSTLVIIAKSVSERVASLVHYINNKQPKPFKLIIVKLPSNRRQQFEMLEDVAIVAGGRCLSVDLGDVPSNISIADLGRAKRVWANNDYFCIEEVEEHEMLVRSDFLLKLQRRYQDASIDDKPNILKRIGRLMGASATIYVGGVNDRQIRDRKDTVKTYISIIRNGLEQGVVAGGGVSFLNARSAIQCLIDQAVYEEEQVAYRILLKALSIPTSILLENAGYRFGVDLCDDEIQAFVLDSKNQLQKLSSPIVFDSLTAVKDAFESAVRTVGLGLTIEVLVHLSRPEFSATP